MQGIIGSGEQTRSQSNKKKTKPGKIRRRAAGGTIADSRFLLREAMDRARRNWIRELWDWARCEHVRLPSVKELNRSIAVLDGTVQDLRPREEESPIFLLATGWRSGSTLLQRIIVTDPDVLLWGEPFGEMALFSQISAMLTALSTSSDIQRISEKNEGKFASLATSWIATLYPSGNDFRQGLRSFLSDWLGEPARKRGFRRWGFKEVRLGAVEATLLHWLFPSAKFVFLSRNPYDCYRSLADSGWHHLYHQRPEMRVDSAAGIARHWNRVALSWSELPNDFPAYRIKYEDLIARKVDFRELEAWLGIKLKEEIALSALVGSTARRSRSSACERLIITHEARAGIRALGYPVGGK